MATVPGTPDNVSAIHPSLQPTQADFLQAAAITHQRQQQAMQFEVLDPEREVQKVFRDFQYGTKDAPNQADIDKLDLGHAITADPDAELRPWRDKLIDLNKLSPRELKATGFRR